MSRVDEEQTAMPDIILYPPPPNDTDVGCCFPVLFSSLELEHQDAECLMNDWLELQFMRITEPTDISAGRNTSKASSWSPPENNTVPLILLSQPDLVVENVPTVGRGIINYQTAMPLVRTLSIMGGIVLGGILLVVRRRHVPKKVAPPRRSNEPPKEGRKVAGAELLQPTSMFGSWSLLGAVNSMDRKYGHHSNKMITSVEKSKNGKSNNPTASSTSAVAEKVLLPNDDIVIPSLPSPCSSSSPSHQEPCTASGDYCKVQHQQEQKERLFACTPPNVCHTPKHSLFRTRRRPKRCMLTAEETSNTNKQQSGRRSLVPRLLSWRMPAIHRPESSTGSSDNGRLLQVLSSTNNEAQEITPSQLCVTQTPATPTRNTYQSLLSKTGKNRHAESEARHVGGSPKRDDDMLPLSKFQTIGGGSLYKSSRVAKAIAAAHNPHHHRPRRLETSSLSLPSIDFLQSSHSWSSEEDENRDEAAAAVLVAADKAPGDDCTNMHSITRSLLSSNSSQRRRQRSPPWYVTVPSSSCASNSDTINEKDQQIYNGGMQMVFFETVNEEEEE